jgi:hypothetical protein
LVRGELFYEKNVFFSGNQLLTRLLIRLLNRFLDRLLESNRLLLLNLSLRYSIKIDYRLLIFS